MARIRSIKPEFWTSEQIVECSRDARLLFIGLWTFADDGGVLPASERAIKMRVFPAEDDIDSNSVRRMLDELSANQLIHEYTVQAKAYIKILGWHHQRIDKPTYKFPGPDAADSASARRTFDDHSTPDVDVEGRGCRGDADVEDRPLDDKSTSTPPDPDDPILIRLPLADKTEHPIQQSQVDEWRELFPAVDVPQALRNMRAWLLTNPARRKTARGIGRFITNWLTRDQDRGGSGRPLSGGGPRAVSNDDAVAEAIRQRRGGSHA